MKVALVLDRFSPTRGGLEQWATGFAAWLLRHGHEVHAVAFAFDDVAVPPGLVLHSLPRPAGRVARARVLGARLRDLGADLVHDFGVGWSYDLLHVHAGSRRTVLRQSLRALPWTLGLRALVRRVRSLGEGRLERRQFAPTSGRIVATSRMVKTHLLRDYGIDPGRVEVVWNGVDTDRFAPAYRDHHRAEARRRLGLGSEVTFLFVAHNYHLKGLQVALHALARLAKEGSTARLCVLGDGSVEPFAALARRLGLGPLARFWPGVADPRPYFAAADVLLHPTFYDSCSLVVLEAWAMGMPAITTRWNGAHELWPAEHDGWLVDDPRDVGTVARAMRAALDPARRTTAGAVGRATALSNQLETNYARILSLYADVSSQGGGALR